MIAAETLAMLNPQPVDDPDTITVEFGTEAAVLHLKIEGRRYEVEVPRIGGRDMGGCPARAPSRPGRMPALPSSPPLTPTRPVDATTSTTSS